MRTNKLTITRHDFLKVHRVSRLGLFCLSVCLGVIACVCSSAAAQESQATAQTSTKTETSRPALRVIVLEGTARERGFKHGTELREEIAVLMGEWKAWIKTTFQQEPDVFIANLCK